MRSWIVAACLALATVVAGASVALKADLSTTALLLVIGVSAAALILLIDVSAPKRALAKILVRRREGPPLMTTPIPMIPGALEPRPPGRVPEPALADQPRIVVAAVTSAGDLRGTDSQAAGLSADESYRSHGLLDPLNRGLLRLTEFVIRLLRTPARV